MLKTEAAREIGCLGYVARASGLAYDARVAHPFTDDDPRLRIPVHTGGDVLARFLVRAEEIDISLALIEHTIVPDFPLTNKSFNLSYAGNDL
ncbi:hypothetical protein ACFYZB_26480 [Streptomyces sp. NPDC001852]|uniref:NADH-quinone oxidoreductase subunit D-related protein n=1 Tax=Streptomyces sp. NPDC001852 TaxID=3364619 RepID=UPI003682D21B